MDINLKTILRYVNRSGNNEFEQSLKTQMRTYYKEDLSHVKLSLKALTVVCVLRFPTVGWPEIRCLVGKQNKKKGEPKMLIMKWISILKTKLGAMTTTFMKQLCL